MLPCGWSRPATAHATASSLGRFPAPNFLSLRRLVGQISRTIGARLLRSSDHLYIYDYREAATVLSPKAACDVPLT
jgi:hypothetical protein